MLELILIGIGIGTYGSMIGVGGGFILVPILLLIYHLTPQQAIGTSLTVLFLNSVSGTISYARQKRIDYVTGVNFAIGTIPGSIIGAYLTKYFSSKSFDIVFGFFLVGLAIFMFIKPKPVPNVDKSRCFPFPFLKKKPVFRELIDVDGKKFEYAFNMPCGIALSFIVGFISSLFGVGGGIIHVPALIYMFCFPVHIAIASSQFIIAISSFVGSVSHLFFDNILFKFALIIGIGGFIGGQIGAPISKKVKGTFLIRFLSVGLILLGIKLLFR